MNSLKLKITGLGVVALAATLLYVLLAAAGTAATQTAKGTVISVTAGKPSEFKFSFSAKSVKHGAVTFKFTDKGALPHALKFCSSPKGGSANSCAGKGTAVISPGKSTTLTITFAKAGSYEYLCTVPGHAAAGMKGDLKVT
jgi:uncharacterized cupredoxin-like copper-binding protein